MGTRNLGRGAAATLVGLGIGLVSLLPLDGPASADGTTYVVEPGDTLFGIARDNGVTLGASRG